MNDKELTNLLNDPRRILNLARVFHQLLHKLDKMEEEKAKASKPRGTQLTKLKDNLEVVCKDKNGKIKSQFKTN